MSRLAIRLSVAAICATAFVVAPAVTPASAHKHHAHMKQHKRHWRHAGGAWVGYPAQQMAPSYSQSGSICPGIGRSFECKIWPPPFEDDPDRKTTKY